MYAHAQCNQLVGWHDDGFALTCGVQTGVQTAARATERKRARSCSICGDAGSSVQYSANSSAVMLANKVSPASLLCSNTRTSQPEMNLVGHGLGGCVEAAAESQQSQASLFTSGSEPASSMELFSEPAYSSSLSSTSQQQTQHSQNEAPSHFSANTLNDGQSQSQNEGRGIQNIQLSGHQHSQGQHNKYYMRYLSSSLGKKQKQPGGATTPLAVGGRQGDTGHSKTAFEQWKMNQQDRLEKQKLIEEVVSLSSSGYAKELKVTLENLRRDVKEALSTEITSSNNRVTAEVAQLKEAEVKQDMLQQLVQGQCEIREQLQDLRALCNQQKAEVVALGVQVSALGEGFTRTIQSALSTEVAALVERSVRPILGQLEARVSELLEELKTHIATTQSRVVAGVREGECSEARNQQCHHPTNPTTTTACVPTLVTGTAPAPVTQPSHCPGASSQIQRKRKGPRDYNSQQPKNNNSSGTKGEEGELARVLLSQSSTQSHSTACDIDLTQHSPLECSQVISDSIQRLKQTSAASQGTSQVEKKAPRTRPGLSPSSSSQAPAAKRKRQTGRVGKRRGPTTNNKGNVSATPRVTRRSQRLSKISAQQSAEKQLLPGVTKCGAKIKREEEKSINILGASEGTGDALDHWLDFQPPIEEARGSLTGGDVKPVSRFQRSSEAVRRRQVVTQQMSSTLASSDSVLQELFSSAPSILSP